MTARLEFGFDKQQLLHYMEQFLMEHDLPQCQKALPFAVDKHQSQKRREGSPYIIHPLTMACHAISLGICEDEILAVILLHDVCEDCAVDCQELPVNEIVKSGVGHLTFLQQAEETKLEALARYYATIPECREAAIVKVFDRCHNVSTMSRAFSDSKLASYAEETEQYVFPLIAQIKERYPEFDSALFALEYQLRSLVEAVRRGLQ